VTGARSNLTELLLSKHVTIFSAAGSASVDAMETTNAAVQEDQTIGLRRFLEMGGFLVSKKRNLILGYSLVMFLANFIVYSQLGDLRSSWEQGYTGDCEQVHTSLAVFTGFSVASLIVSMLSCALSSPLVILLLVLIFLAWTIFTFVANGFIASSAAHRCLDEHAQSPTMYRMVLADVIISYLTIVATVAYILFVHWFPLWHERRFRQFHDQDPEPVQIDVASTENKASI